MKWRAKLALFDVKNNLNFDNAIKNVDHLSDALNYLNSSLNV